MGESEAVEEIPETYEGVVAQDGVFIASSGSLADLGYGFKEDGGVLLPDVEALHLMRRGVLQVLDQGRLLAFEEVLRRGLSSEPSLFLKYLVFRDMRSKGRRIRAGLSGMPYLWFYENPSKPCSHMVAIYPRNQSIRLDELESLLTLGGRFKKGVYLALVDEEGEASYYEVKRFTTRSREAGSVERTDIAHLVGPMTVVWDTTGALSLYREGYFGKPIGLRKPKSMDFDRPIMLSHNESIYLAEMGRVRLDSQEGELTSSALAELASSEPNFRERLIVYRELKSSGLVVKSGMKFGVDFAVYEYGPGLDHAPFLIHVHPEGSSITPTEIVRAGRLAASVKKKFIIAEVDAGSGRVRMISFARVKP